MPLQRSHTGRRQLLKLGKLCQAILQKNHSSKGPTRLFVCKHTERLIQDDCTALFEIRSAATNRHFLKSSQLLSCVLSTTRFSWFVVINSSFYPGSRSGTLLVWNVLCVWLDSTIVIDVVVIWSNDASSLSWAETNCDRWRDRFHGISVVFHFFPFIFFPLIV